MYDSKEKYGLREALRDVNFTNEKNSSDCSDKISRQSGRFPWNIDRASIIKNVATVDNNELLKYKSPITIVAAQLRMQTENNVWKCIQDMGIDINKEELLKALEYDREQYTKGYEDAKVEFGKYANWRSCEEALPSIGEHVLVQTICDTIHAVFFRGTSKCWGENIDTYIRPSMVKYWAPLLPIKED